jgi:NAD(P)-dependent dehydrogenase (short-subunit alcohol dehydrogenase family)
MTDRQGIVGSVLITGTSSGLGLSMAVHLAKKGWLVYASMRDPDRRQELDSAVKESGADPERIHVLRLDVTDSSSISSSLDEIADRSGRLDALINNAGVNIDACLEDIDMADARRLFDTLVLGAIVLTHAALPLLRKSSDPRVIFVSSSAAVTGGPTATIYSAAKAAIEKFAESLALEVAADRIRIIVLRPGIHRSNISHRNSGRVRPPASRYRALYDRVDPLHQAAISCARDPMNVACKVGKALDARRPRFRYHIGWDSYLATATNPFIPQRLRHLTARLLFRPKSKNVQLQRN